MSAMKLLKKANFNYPVVLVILGAFLTSTSLPWALQTLAWTFSDNWNKPGNAMPLLMVFIIPLAIVSWLGLAFGITALVAGLYKALRVPIPESLSDLTRNKILNRNILIFLILSATVLYNLNVEMPATTFVLLTLLELVTLSFAAYFSYKTHDKTLYMAWGAAILLLLILTFVPYWTKLLVSLRFLLG